MSTSQVMFFSLNTYFYWIISSTCRLNMTSTSKIRH